MNNPRMTRTIRSSLISLCLLAFALSWSGAKPNVIVVLVDDMGLSLIHISEPTRPY